MTHGSEDVVAGYNLRNELARIVAPDGILTRPIDVVAFASDASFYRLTPKAVVLARGIPEIQGLFRLSHESRIPLTFRAAGTSLSGQAITDGILVEVARYWRQASVLDAGQRIRVQPGVIGGTANRLLAPYGSKIGPDPASINACMMGGILSNNSSGMCCGVSQNAYHTLASMVFVLPSGTVVDTANADADDLLRVHEPKLVDGLLQLKKEILASSCLQERIRHKYRIKNTTGYSLNAFLDFDRAIDIFQHLLIGAEGSLAFIAEAVLHTVPDLGVKYTGLLLFRSLREACAAIVPLREAGAKAIELMDREALRSVQNQEGIPPTIKSLSGEAAALLVEFQAARESERESLQSRARQATATLPLLEPPNFTHDREEQALLWKVRKGMFPSVGAVRRSGTSVILEDVVFPVEKLADACLDLRRLLTKHGYEDAILFGHAQDGNLHFVITQSFNDQKEINRYAVLMDDVVELVVDRYDGSLKGEHGTGRNMAPFVEAEWGAEAAAIMRRLKELADPENLLNPGVIINPDRTAHLSNLKSLPSVEEEVDKCIECGYCEVVCPSRDLTLTPRQRIIVRREMARLEQGPAADRKTLASIHADFPYMALHTCAVDGLCATACPVGIDTGTLTKRFRRQAHSPSAQRLACWVARHFGVMERSVRFALRSGRFAQSIVGPALVTRISKSARRLIHFLPQWSADLPHPASPLPSNSRDKDAAAVYFPSCISRTMGFLPGEPSDTSLMEVIIKVAHRAGRPVTIPDSVPGTCCGVPFSSKGYDQAYRLTVNQTIRQFWKWSDEGRLPIIVDTSPCTYSLLACRPYLTAENQQRFDRMCIRDGIAFAHDELLPRLKLVRKLSAVVLHPVCSTTKMKLAGKLHEIGQACSHQVFVLPSTGCCGFAGDRGMLYPELTKSATQQQGEEVRAMDAEGYFSSSRMCELAMTRAAGHVYRSYFHLLEMASRE